MNYENRHTSKLYVSIYVWCKCVKICKKLKEYYNYVIIVIFKVRQREALKRNCKVFMILFVFIIKSLYFRALFDEEMQPINWVIKVN